MMTLAQGFTSLNSRDVTRLCDYFFYIKFAEKDPLCFFCGVEDESVPHLFGGLCPPSYILEEILFVSLLDSFKDVLFGFYRR